jgi:hypothetical protein
VLKISNSVKTLHFFLKKKTYIFLENSLKSNIKYLAAAAIVVLLALKISP